MGSRQIQFDYLMRNRKQDCYAVGRRGGYPSVRPAVALAVVAWLLCGVARPAYAQGVTAPESDNAGSPVSEPAATPAGDDARNPHHHNNNNVTSDVADGGDDAAKFADLSLEELMKVEVVPVNVLGTHTHYADQWMIGLRVRRTQLKGLRVAAKDVDARDILPSYKIVGSEMDSTMTMLMLMYAPTDKLTVMAMFQYMIMDMDHLDRNLKSFISTVHGPGDTELSATYAILEAGKHRALLNLGVSLPTGSIDLKGEAHGVHASHAVTDVVPTRYAYDMQLGSGTLDPILGVTYLGHGDGIAWGGEVGALLRVYNNRNGYRRGNAYRAGAWLAKNLTDWFDVTPGLEGSTWGNIVGADPDLIPADFSMNDGKTVKGQRVEGTLALNMFVPEGRFKNIRLAIRGAIPIYEYLRGPALKTRFTLDVGFQQTF